MKAFQIKKRVAYKEFAHGHWWRAQFRTSAVIGGAHFPDSQFLSAFMGGGLVARKSFQAHHYLQSHLPPDRKTRLPGDAFLHLLFEPVHKLVPVGRIALSMNKIEIRPPLGKTNVQSGINFDEFGFLVAIVEDILQRLVPLSAPVLRIHRLLNRLSNLQITLHLGDLLSSNFWVWTGVDFCKKKAASHWPYTTFGRPLL